jgi:hypothetical protein
MMRCSLSKLNQSVAIERLQLANVSFRLISALFEVALHEGRETRYKCPSTSIYIISMTGKNNKSKVPSSISIIKSKSLGGFGLQVGLECFVDFKWSLAQDPDNTPDVHRLLH